MKSLSLIFIVLFSMCQQASDVKRFDVPELGLSFEEPDWYGVKNVKFTDTLQNYNWDVLAAITESTNAGGIDIIRYHKDSIPADENLYLKISVGGLHKSLQDFDKLIAFTRDTKLIVPNLKIIQPITEINVSGKRAITDFKSFTEINRHKKYYKIFTKSVSIFMGDHTYNFYIRTKDKEDIEVFDDLVKTIVITK